MRRVDDGACSRSASAPRGARTGWVFPLAAYLVPLGLGLLHFRESSENPFFTTLLSDDRLYLAWGREIAAGKGFGPVPYYVSPLYLWFLAALARLGAVSPGAIRLVQLCVGCLIWPLVFLLGERLFGRRAGIIAALLCGGYGTLLFSLGDLSAVWLETLLVASLALLLARGGGVRELAASGLAVGVLALARPTLLVFALLLPAVMLATSGRGQPILRRRELARGAIFLAAALLPVLPVTVRNLVVGGDLVAVASHGGINFYLGNSEGSPGTIWAPPGMTPDIPGLNDAGARKVAEAAVGRPLRPSEVSRYWYGRGLDFLAGNPLAAARLYARKLLLLFHAHETASHADYGLFRERSRVLALLRIPFSLLIVGAAFGVYLARRRWREEIPLLLLLGVLLLTPLAFFAAFRFRLPAAPLLAVFAGHALDRGLAAWRAGPRSVALPAAGLLAGVVLLSWPWGLVREIDQSHRAHFHQTLGVRLFEQGRPGRARESFEQALALRPSLPDAHWYLARILESEGNYAAARGAWLRAAHFYGPGTQWGLAAAERVRQLDAGVR